MRGGWGDFARLCPGERVGREPLQPTLVPQYQGVGATGRGRQCSLRRRVPRGASGGKTKARGCFNWGGGGSGVPVFICAWEVCLKCAAPGAASGSPHSPYPPPLTLASPGAGLAVLGTASWGTSSEPFGCRPEPAWVQGKVRGSCRGCCVRWERSCARGRGTRGWRARGRVERCVPRGLSRGGRGTGGVYVPRLG